MFDAGKGVGDSNGLLVPIGVDGLFDTDELLEGIVDEIGVGPAFAEASAGRFADGVACAGNGWLWTTTTSPGLIF